MDEERIKFQKVNEEDYFILTIEDVKNSNDDYKKITEIFDKEGFFNSILYKK